MADSRVTSPNGVLSDNVPKLFSIPLYCYQNGDLLQAHPSRILNPMLAISGSTFIGLNFKEVLANYLGNLQELSFYDRLDISDGERLPTMLDLAELARRIAEVYLRSFGVLNPRSAHCEFALFGFCKKSDSFKAFTLSNSPSEPANISIREHLFSKEEFLILGDKKDQVADVILATRQQYDRGTLNWQRAPILALSTILQEESIPTIGGYLQLWTAQRDFNKKINFSTAARPLPSFLGIDIYNELGFIGGYSSNNSISLTLPAHNGWPETRRLGDLVREKF